MAIPEYYHEIASLPTVARNDKEGGCHREERVKRVTWRSRYIVAGCARDCFVAHASPLKAGEALKRRWNLLWTFARNDKERSLPSFRHLSLLRYRLTWYGKRWRCAYRLTVEKCVKYTLTVLRLPRRATLPFYEVLISDNLACIKNILLSCHREESLTLVKGEWTTWRSRCIVAGCVRTQRRCVFFSTSSPCSLEIASGFALAMTVVGDCLVTVFCFLISLLFSVFRQLISV